MLKENLVIASAFFLASCRPASSGLGIVSQSGQSLSPVYTFALAEEEVQRMKQESFEKVLYRPHPSREREMIANLPMDPAKEGEQEAPKRFVSEDGFPLITFQGGPMLLGEALEFIAGAAGYRVEFEEGINKALPVSTAFTDTPLHKAVAALIEPFGYFAVVDGQKALVKIGLKPEVEVGENPSASKSSGKERQESPAEAPQKRDRS